MSILSSTAAIDSSAVYGTLHSSDADVPSSEKVSAFNKLLYAGTPQGDVGQLSPSQMLAQQATLMGTTVSVDLGAKVAGAVSQSVNKLANMT
ncbi:type III secretion system inner rod subunit SctI [Lonsdalea quercina]|uniref:type III secretion system inner rod subunit SctI n=1 Tax=Lonsdalea quercina TaxID=71657 RepID=UPI00047A8AD1|nr:type III secretion system inner rod subunit SctI [Lonsdalea quercina]